MRESPTRYLSFPHDEKLAKLMNLYKSMTCYFIKKSLLHKCFPVNFVKFLRTPFFYRTPPVAASDNISLQSRFAVSI